MPERTNSPGSLTWTDDASRGALSRRIYDRIIEFCRAEISEHHVPLLLQAIDEAIDGEATALQIAAIDESPHDMAAPRLVGLYADGLPGDRLLVLDLVRVLLGTYSFAVERVDDGVRQHLEVIINPTMETWLRSLGLPQERVPLVSTPAYSGDAA